MLVMTYLRVELPPRPVSQLPINTRIPLDSPYRNGAIKNLLHLASRSPHSSHRLQPREDIKQESVSAFLELGQNACLKEDLGGAHFVDRLIKFESIDHA